MEREVIAAGGEIVHLPVATKSPLGIWRNARAIAALIKQHNVDVVHARSRAPAWSAYFAAKRCNVPFVTTYHGLYKSRSPLKRWYNSVMARGAAVIAVSQFIGQHVAQTYPKAAARVFVIPRGVDLTHFLDSPISRLRLESLLRAWHLTEDTRRVILMPGRISATKGHGVLIDALALLRQQRDDFVCVCVGDNDGKNKYAKRLEQRIMASGLSGCVRFPGHTPDMPAAYALSDVVVVPSTRPEAFGRVPVEAQALARPVVAAAHGGACETIVHGVTGFLVEPHSAIALADGLEAALSMDEEQRCAMAQAGLNSVLAIYRTDRMCKQTLEVYEQVIRGGRNTMPPQMQSEPLTTPRLI